MFINLHTHHKNEDKSNVFAIQNIIYGTAEMQISATPISVGVHPWYLQNEVNWDDFTAFAQSKNVVAIGECGLDKVIKTPISVQMPIFVQQIRIAERLQKPVIVHCVRAYNEVLSVLKQEKPTIPIILHGFNKNEQVAKLFFDYNVYFSFGTHILKENFDGGILKIVFQQNKLFLETDNTADISIENIYKSAAKHLNITINDLENELESDFFKVFTIKT